MRFKRSKKYRKIMQQYTLNFGFREPYQVLVDSNHLRAIHSFKISLNQYLENTLHGKVKPFITRCTLASILQTTDLQTSRRPDFLPPPADLPLRHCSHANVAENDVLSEEGCLLDLLGGGVTGNQLAKNKQHFILATADAPVVKEKEKKRSFPEKFNQRPAHDAPQPEGIRVLAREIPGVPIIYVKRSVMTLEELSGASLNVRRRTEKDKLREGLLGSGSRKRKRDDDDGKDEEGESGESDGLERSIKKPRKKSGPKAPNPLSILKKKKKPLVRPSGDDSTLVGSKQAEKPKLGENTASAEGTEQPSAKRKRKHRPKNKIGGDVVDEPEKPNGVSAIVQ